MKQLVMRYPVAIEAGGESTAFGVVVPDLPGCFSAGDTLDEAMTNAEEAMAAWIDATLDAGGALPQPSALEALRSNPDYTGWSIGVVSIDPALFDDTIDGSTSRWRNGGRLKGGYLVQC